MTSRKPIKDEIRHLTRPIKVALVFTVAAIIGWGAAMRAVHSHFKETQHVRSAG